MRTTLRNIIFGFLFAAAMFMGTAGFALANTGTIDSTNKYAWSNKIGWINFAPSNGNVLVSDTEITGYAWSETLGWIKLNPVNGGITNTTSGVLSGSAWGQNVGWINFSGVTINTSTGRFSGTATGDLVGTISFNCTNCVVITDWRPSSGGGGGGGGGGGPPWIPPNSHTECSAQRCVAVSGPGTNQCSVNNDCINFCGNGVRDLLEQCDDGNTTNGDGCSSLCKTEPGWRCSPGAGGGSGGSCSSSSPTFTSYPVNTTSSGPTGITTGADGNLWFTEYTGNKIGRITPTGAIAEYAIPTTSSSPHAITAGADGNVWFSERSGGKIGKITPSGVITEYNPTSPTAGAIGMTLGSDGNVWIAESATNKIGKITPAGVITEYLVPTANSQPSDIALGPDGNLWFTERTGNKIGKITTGGVITEYSLPTANSGPVFIAGGFGGNLWFTQAAANKIGKITTAGVVTEYSVPTANSYPFFITDGPDGNMWFTEYDGNKIGKITPAGVITEYVSPVANSDPQGITAGPDGNIWFADSGENAIVKMTLGCSGSAPTTGSSASSTSSASSSTASAASTADVCTPIVLCGNGVRNLSEQCDDGNRVSGDGCSSVCRVELGWICEPEPAPTPISYNILSFVLGATSDGSIWTRWPQNYNGPVSPITVRRPNGTTQEIPVDISQGSPDSMIGGSDGNLWFAARGGGVARINNNTLQTTYFNTVSSLSINYNQAITSGPDGNIWFVSADTQSNLVKVVRMTTAGVITGQFTHPELLTIVDATNYNTPANPYMTANDSYVWVASGRKFYRVTPATGAITMFPGPPELQMNLAYIAADSNNDIWFFNNRGDQNFPFGKISSTGAVTMYPVQSVIDPDGSLNSLGPIRYLATGSDGNIWTVADFGGHGLGRISPDGQLISMYWMYGQQIIAGTNRSMWLSDGCATGMSVCNHGLLEIPTSSLSGGGSGGGGGGSGDICTAIGQHNICNSQQQCVAVPGQGTNQCQGNSDCAALTHTQCSNQQCVTMSGPGTSQCTSNANCQTPVHNACNAQNQCVSVVGPGLNSCQVNSDCSSQSHSECSNLQCVIVQGAGINQCLSDQVCKSPVHNACNSQNQCVVVSGQGVNQCQGDGDCASQCTDPLGNENWRGVAMSGDGRYQTATTNANQIYTSNNYGVAWTARDSARLWYGIAMSSDGKIQTAVAEGDKIYTSDNYGVTWVARNSNRYWHGIAMSSDGKVQTATAGASQIYTSTDYGATWVPRENNRDWAWVAMSSDGRYQTATVVNGQIYTSADFGITWNARDSNRTWGRVAMSSEGRNQVVIAMSGQIYTSDNYGVAWTARDSNRYWQGIAMSGDGRYQSATVMNGKIYTSDNYGVTWTARDSNRYWYGVAMSSDGRYQTTVDGNIFNGTPYTSTDYGVTWVKQDQQICATLTHTECSNQQCISVNGPGINQCTSNASCQTPVHNACNAQNQCVVVQGPGTNQCQTTADCAAITHTECSNLQCVIVQGAGINQCSSNLSCQAPSHTTCNAQRQCVVVPGSGTNQCQADIDCVVPEHTICQNQQCKTVTGVGSNQCQTNTDCVSTHFECQFEQCIAINGIGINQCQSASDCKVPRYNACQNDQCVVMIGSAPNQCQSNGDCLIFHNECNFGVCTSVRGVGINQCSNSSQCGQPVHNECQNSQCITVPGSGINQCLTATDCTIPRHNACKNQQCVLVDGAGSNQCQASEDCQIKFPDIILEIPGISGIIKNQTALTTAKAIVAVGAAGGVAAAGFSLYNLFLWPFKLFNLILVGFGFKRKKTNWGVVYDSVTKQPLDPAYVRLLTSTGRQVDSAITDLDGRYGFLAPAGTYTISAKKTNYVFPSQKLAGKRFDEVYSNLYFGESLTLQREGDVIMQNIPLDPTGFDWNEFAKRDKKLMIFYSKWETIFRKISTVIFWFGFIIAVLLFIFEPRPFNTIMLVIYLVMVLLRIVVIKPKPYGFVVENATHIPLSFAIVRVVLPDVHVEITHAITDKYGRYYCLVPPGKFYIKIEKKNLDGSYSLVHTSPIINFAKKGIINKKFMV